MLGTHPREIERGAFCMKAIILAGGEGTRLKAVTGERPKPMVPLLGRPLMEYTLLWLRRYGFTEICAAVRYRAQDIIDHFGDGSAFGVALHYRTETDAWGTAGAERRCREMEQECRAQCDSMTEEAMRRTAAYEESVRQKIRAYLREHPELRGAVE